MVNCSGPARFNIAKIETLQCVLLMYTRSFRGDVDQTYDISMMYILLVQIAGTQELETGPEDCVIPSAAPTTAQQLSMRVRARWLLAVTLLNNPSAAAFRARGVPPQPPAVIESPDAATGAACDGGNAGVGCDQVVQLRAERAPR